MAIKKSMEALVAYLSTEALSKKTVHTVVNSAEFLAFVEAKRGGGNVEENWLIVNDVKVARACAMLDTFYPHNNEDKAVSHFYKNGSYHIVVEKLKNLKVKAHKAETDTELQRLEDEMMEGTITPKEWLVQKNEVLKEFKFEISDETKAHLVTLTKGYETKEALATAMADENTDTDFKAIEDDVNKYLATVEAELFPTPTEDTEEATEGTEGSEVA